MCRLMRGSGAALVVRFATPVVFWSDACSVGPRAHAHISLEGPFEGPDVLKARGERDPDNRVVMSAHQFHRATHAEDSHPLGERRADLGMEEGGEVLSLQAGELRGGGERDGHRDVGGDEPEHGRQAGVVRERLVMDALRQAGYPDEPTHERGKMRQHCLLPPLNRRTHTPSKRRKRYAWPIDVAVRIVSRWNESAGCRVHRHTSRQDPPWQQSPTTTSPRSTSESAASCRSTTFPRRASPLTSCASTSASWA